MKYKIVTLALLLFLSACHSAKDVMVSANQPFDQASNAHTIFGNANWNFLNNELIGELKTNGAGYIMTKDSYKDFIMELSFYPDSLINSGIFVRCANYEINPDDCHEINIWDLHPNQDFRTGAIVKKVKPLVYIETLNQWNNYKIKCQGSHCEIWLNGTLTATITDPNRVEGYIGLQAMGLGKIKFKDISLHSL